jgi:diguanylate cyclase (GGDEF)-like protein
MQNRNKNEIKFLKMNKEIITLKEASNEKSSFISIIGQVLKYSNNITHIENYMKNILDMQIGILGLKSAAVFLNNNNVIKKYIINNSKDNKFFIEEIKAMPEGLLNINGIEVFRQKNNISTLRMPIKRMKTDEVVGYIIATQDSHNFFNDTKKAFYENLGIIIMNSITNFNLYNRVKTLSEKDILTGCYNRRFFDDFKEKYKNCDNVSLIIFDIDKFKDINDTYGHNVGDIVLKKIAKKAKEIFEKVGGKVIRFGGDEFVVVLNRELKFANKKTVEFKKSVETLKFEAITGKQPTASFGITSYPKQIDDFEELLIFADKSLYKAKKNGRNKIVTH